MQTATPETRPGPPFLNGGGAIAALIAGHDWSSTSLGPIQFWPQTVKTATALMLRSDVPIVMLWGPQGVMVYNDAYAVFAGGRHPRLLGSKVREGWPEVAAFNDNVMKTVLAGNTLAYRDQELVLHRSGKPEQVWMNLDYSPLLDEQGRPAGVMAIVIETSAKVRAERRVRGERERLRQMFQQAPGFFAMMSGPDHVIDLANAAYMQLVGHRDVVGLPVRKALPELEGQGYFEVLDHVYQSGKAFTGAGMAVTLQRSPGAPTEERFVDLVYQPLRDEENRIVGIVAQGSDVTERLLAEKALRASEERFRTFSQAMPNHVWAAASDGLLNWFNDEVYAYSGAQRGDLDGGGWASIVHPEDLEKAYELWSKSLATGDTYEARFRLRRADGAWRWHIARAMPIRGEDGQVVEWIGSNTDIEDGKA